jgi:MerR family transcriptional regulator, heat shock protein HspR
MKQAGSKPGSTAKPSAGTGGRSQAGDREDRAVYIISVAAELAGVHPQTLRIYERKGLLRPARTAGNTRRYSDRDIARLRMIQRLTQEQGLNLAGVKMIVEMEDQIDRMRERMGTLDRELRQARVRLREEIERLRKESQRGEIVPASTVPRLRIRLSPQSLRRGPIAVGPTGTSTIDDE